ncbi:hypothetical protein [Chitinophaga arvensicola]|uniref:Uncharacterized protein n=1 Tax=Chitinophaga arvensicola TaxID=29529 RepID=A0A1I0NNF0_9BACT|nr:hypothetical protein [Chitinophaga arvensicola]SEW02387.1 hypothetical protein SAMN04488122_0255 [Chitinophaga arvensicola]
MQLKPGTCYKIKTSGIAALQQFGDYEFIVAVIHANDTSDSAVFEFKKIIGHYSTEQEIATRQAVETHADGFSLEDITGHQLNLVQFERESEFLKWVAIGIAVPINC